MVLLALAVPAVGCTDGAEPEGALSDEAAGPQGEARRHGRLVIVGGSLADENEPVHRAVLEGTAGEGPLCVVPTASGDPRESMESAVEEFRAWADSLEVGTDSVRGVFVSTENPEAASDTGVAATLRSCSGFWFTGGSQSRVGRVFRPDGSGTPGYDALIGRFEEGAVVAGTSAGAAMMPPRMIAGGGSEEALLNGVVSRGEGDGVLVVLGMGFFDDGIIDQHFLARGRIGRLLVTTLAGEGGGIGLGLDENTAVVVDGTDATVLGDSGMILVDARDADRSEAGHGGRGVRLHLLGAGDALDLSTLTVERAPDKRPVETSAGEVEVPDEPFARWAFLHVLAQLAASEDEAVEMTAAGHAFTLRKSPDFGAVSYGEPGVEGTPSGLSAGPFLVSLVPRTP